MKHELNFYSINSLITDCKEHDCIVESDPFSYGNQALIIHNNHKTQISKSYSYDSFTKFLTENQSNNSMKIIIKYFWQNWIINRRVDQLLNRNECTKQLLLNPLTDQFSDFLFNARLSVSRVSAKNQWQKIQIKKLYYFLKITRDSIKQFKSGSLSLYSNDIIISLKNSLKQMSNDSTMNIKLIFDMIKDIINIENLKLNETKSFVSKRIQQFIRRLVISGVNSTLKTIPKLSDNRNYVQELYNVLKWIQENSLFAFDLPNDLKEMLFRLINYPSINISADVSNYTDLCKKSLEKNQIKNQMNQTLRDSIDLLISLLKSSLDLNVWNSWLELHDKWKHIIRTHSHLILVNGEHEDHEDNDSHSNSERLFCKREALKQLLLWNITPDWLKNKFEIENSPSVNSFNIEFRSKFNSIYRSDFDLITGYKFWSIVIMCECYSIQFCNHNKKE